MPGQVTFVSAILGDLKQWLDGVNSGGMCEATAQLMDLRKFLARLGRSLARGTQPSREASWLTRPTPIKRAARISQAQRRTRVC